MATASTQQIVGVVAPADPTIASKWLIAIAAMLATLMEVPDTTIANVAFYHIPGGLSVGVDEATWVLTSYIVANAIVIPLTGWCGAYFGRRTGRALRLIGRPTMTLAKVAAAWSVSMRVKF